MNFYSLTPLTLILLVGKWIPIHWVFSRETTAPKLLCHCITNSEVQADHVQALNNLSDAKNCERVHHCHICTFVSIEVILRHHRTRLTQPHNAVLMPMTSCILLGKTVGSLHLDSSTRLAVLATKLGNPQERSVAYHPSQSLHETLCAKNMELTRTNNVSLYHWSSQWSFHCVIKTQPTHWTNCRGESKKGKFVSYL